MTTTTPLEQIPRDAAFPVTRLAGLEDALVLFAAAWHGKQDAVFLADAGIVGTCVDLDETKLDEMRAIYPASWSFSQADAFHYARTWRTAGRRWDAATIDCPTNLFDRCAAELPLWCDVARRLVVLGCGRRTHIDPPDGWALVDVVQRSSFRGGVQWAVIERRWS
jgi:hypothetical protein